MSTRGLYGYIENGEYSADYNHSDSYPSGLGLEFFISCRDGDFSGYGQDRLLKFEISIDDQNDISFIKESLFCEWAYFYDKDKKIFEIWRGFQKSPDPTNPFGQKTIDGYYPCKRIFSGKIDLLKEEYFIGNDTIEESIKMITRDIKIDKILKNETDTQI